MIRRTRVSDSQRIHPPNVTICFDKGDRTIGLIGLTEKSQVYLVDLVMTEGGLSEGQQVVVGV